ncbi:MAG TPA: polyprenyl synthetase family protein [Nitrospiria bacterium]|nr:polyprenyl synthetase family protein [Nitrospiria bacterium]
MLSSAKSSSFLTVQDIWERYRPDLLKVEAQIQKNLSSEVPLINQVAQYILNSGGKRIRPLLMILSSKLCSAPGEDHILLAAVVEFIHTATLLHDDVIDEGNLRRGKKTARTLWGNHASILVGDYLYATAVAHGLSLNNQEVNFGLQRACSQMIEGEMVQHVHNSDLAILESDYLRIIQHKTASLIAAACQLGGIVSGASPEQKECLYQFGQNLGIAFQVADDTLDYIAQTQRLGKTLGADLREGKVTLPLIHLLRNCSDEEKKRVTHTFRANDASEKRFDEILDLMHRHGSIEYAFSMAREYIQKSTGFLESFGPSVHKAAMEVVADYVVSRDH